MTQTVLKLDHNGTHIIVIKDNTAQINPYRIYRKWYEYGWHRELVTKYADFDSVLYWLMSNRGCF